MPDAGRVIAGRAAGRRLAAPPGEGTRPLADRVKQTLFAILEPDLVDATVLDLFAGSGAAGIEALSRGAASAHFVERDGRAAKTIGDNLRATGLAGPTAVVVTADVLAWLRRPATADGPPFDVVVVDPPYADTELLAAVLAELGAEHAPLAPAARVVAKHFWRDRPSERIGLLASERERRFGETALTFYRRSAEEVG
jgi:16S rRNA (guanine(966)-N(2))-methyltransferase RsmD